MTTATYAGLRAATRADSLKPAAKETMPEEEEAEEAEAEESGDEPKGKKKEKEYMNDEANAAVAAARADERARCVAVFTSQHADGRADKAAALLANDKLSADEIVTILAAMAPAEKPDPEAAARAEMKAALEDNANFEIEANDGAAPKTEAKSADVWDAAYAKVFGPNKTA